eukprot:TRINITY_DN48963_c0_g1_i2.p1 TRINITY_DN48963_c0_g1~~TRINITY_DN48963_c0_g1_i2.p1  ORF type:complete len:452 (-),score=65.24 TRINITY_DN48963_c0_g1_i2:99-1325(-)
MAAAGQPRATASNWQTWPHLRWGFQHMDEILPTAKVLRGGAERPVCRFEVAEKQLRLDQLALPPWVGAANALAYLESVHTDAFVVVKDRKIVCEQYLGEQTADRPHIVQSITKSLVALTAACCFDVLERKGERLTEKLLPELTGSGYEDSTLGHLLDMTCATQFSEAYADPSAPAGGSDMTGLCMAMTWHPRERPEQRSDPALANIRSFLRSLRRKRGTSHGTSFTYQSTTSECLCWAVEAAAGGRAPGRQFEELLSSKIWAKLGQEHDANITVDDEGVCGVSGGFSCTARDLARVGQLLVDEGRCMAGEQIIPPEFIADCLAPDAATRARYSSEDPYGQAYKNNFWICGKSHSDASLMGYGIHGQVLWAEPSDKLVIVKMSSSEHPMDDFEYAATMEVLQAVRRALR